MPWQRPFVSNNENLVFWLLPKSVQYDVQYHFTGVNSEGHVPIILTFLGSHGLRIGADTSLIHPDGHKLFQSLLRMLYYVNTSITTFVPQFCWYLVMCQNSVFFKSHFFSVLVQILLHVERAWPVSLCRTTATVTGYPAWRLVVEYLHTRAVYDQRCKCHNLRDVGRGPPPAVLTTPGLLQR